MGNNSCVQEAYQWQGVERDSNGKITYDSFPGHDNLQNGVIPDRSDSTIYCTKWFDGQPGSGFFTDEATVDACTHNGKLNSNELGDALQTEPSNYGTHGGDYQHKPYCTAYDVDWDRLNEIKNENPDLYGRLTNSDGLSPDNHGIKCAYGKAEANPQYGQGGGNQYYIDKGAFNEAVDAGVFKENKDKSFSEEKGNLERADIPNTPEYNIELQSAKNDVIDKEDAKGTPTPEQLNGYQVTEDPGMPYMAQPDEAYGYGQSQDTKNEDVIKASTDSGEKNNIDIHAPPGQEAEPIKQQAAAGGGTESNLQSNQNQQAISQDVQNNQSQQSVPQGEQNNQSQQSVTQGTQNSQSQQSTARGDQNRQNQGASGMPTTAYGSTGGSSDKTSETQGRASDGSSNTESASQGKGQQYSDSQSQESSHPSSQSSSDGMSTTAAGSQCGNTNSSEGMSNTAAGQNSSMASSSGAHSNNSGMGI